MILRLCIALPAAAFALVAIPAGAQPGDAGRQVVMTLLFYNACAASYPEMGARHARGYKAWRGRNSTMIAVLEGEPGVKAAIGEAVRRAKENAGPDKDSGAKSQCEDFMAATFLESASGPMKTPEDAWKRLTDSLRAGDLNRALECYSPASRAKYRKVFEDLGPAGMKSFAASISAFRADFPKPGEDLATGWVTLDKGSASQVVFVRDAATGGWLVESM
jgi:hypothetical protein